MAIRPLFDQSIFVKAALNSVVMGGLMAAAADGIDDSAFSRQLASDVDYSGVNSPFHRRGDAGDVLLGQTLNTMTLGGFALAVGILVDNSTVVIENIERHLGMKGTLDHLPDPQIESVAEAARNNRNTGPLHH